MEQREGNKSCSERNKIPTITLVERLIKFSLLLVSSNIHKYEELHCDTPSGLCPSFVSFLPRYLA